MYRYKNIGILFVQSDNFVYLCHETLVKELKGEKVPVLFQAVVAADPDCHILHDDHRSLVCGRIDLTMLVVQYHKHD